jgi:hypothetical protein
MEMAGEWERMIDSNVSSRAFGRVIMYEARWFNGNIVRRGAESSKWDNSGNNGVDSVATGISRKRGFGMLAAGKEVVTVKVQAGATGA